MPDFLTVMVSIFVAAMLIGAGYYAYKTYGMPDVAKLANSSAYGNPSPIVTKKSLPTSTIQNYVTPTRSFSSPTPRPPAVQKSCTDSDSHNTSSKGYVTGVAASGSYKTWDYCFDYHTVMEQYCDENSSREIGYSCKFTSQTCADGRCA